MIVNEHMIERGIERFRKALQEAIKEHGNLAFSSRHELYGLLAEEHKEILDELNEGDQPFIDELLHAAVICIYGEICMKEGLTE